MEALAMRPTIGTTMEVEAIGPNEAQKYLNTAAPNRGIRAGKVSQYARDMRRELWYSSILRFDTAGRLVDGQHRLRAVIESGTDQLFYVERGVTAAAVKTIDTGLGRSIGDHLAMSGELNAPQLGSALRYFRLFTLFPGQVPSSQAQRSFSAAELEELLSKEPDIRHSVSFAKTMAATRLPYGSSGIAAAVRYIGMKRDRAKAIDFWDQISTGAEQHEGTGPYALRRLVIADKLRPYGTRMNINELAAVTIKAWNYWEHGLPIKMLRWLKGNEVSEAFPKIGDHPKR